VTLFLHRLVPLLVAAALGPVGAVRAQVTDVSGISAVYDKVLSIQPIQVCNSSGSSCPGMPIFAGALIRTLAQAGIAAAVLPTSRVFDTTPDALTLVTVRFESARADVRLRSLAIDLPDFTPVRPAQLPASFSAEISHNSGTVTDVAFGYTENMQTSFTRGGASDEWTSSAGGPELVIDFGVGGMAEGQELTFEMGVVGDLRGEWSYPIGRDLYGGDATFEFDFGLTGTVAMADAAGIIDSRALRSIGVSVADPAPFGRQLAPGEYSLLGPVDLDPVPTPVPEPASALLLLGGAMTLAAWQRKRQSAAR